jgi:hypothetical protein
MIVLFMMLKEFSQKEFQIKVFNKIIKLKHIKNNGIKQSL